MNQKVECPSCSSNNTVDVSIYESNDIIGPGYSCNLVREMWECKECGTYFNPHIKTKKDERTKNTGTQYY